MKKHLYILCCLLLLAIGHAFSQVNYSFSAFYSSYNTIQNGQVVTLNPLFNSGINATDEGYSNTVPIGFSFQYSNDQTVNSLKVCTNGFVLIGNDFQDGSVTPQDGYYINNLFNGPSSYSTATGLVKAGHADQRSVIAPFWGDLDVQQNSNLVYQTTGNAPNRVFTLEWKNIKWDYQCIAAVGSFQLIIHETSNVIEFAYQNLQGTPSSTAKASIGLTTKNVGFESFISLQDNSSKPAISNFNENNSITAFPASNIVYRFVPHTAYNNNLSLSTVYNLGTICKNGESYAFSANVFNAGKQNAIHVPVNLSVAGNNSFSSTKYIENLAPGNSTVILFDAFMPGANSTDNLTVSLPADDDNSDNLISKNISITNNVVSNVSLANNLYQDNGIGNNVPSEFATRFTTQNFKSINDITLYFSNETNSAPFDITVYDANGIDNKPGAILWQQKGLTSQPGSLDINVSTGITVHGQYFISVTQSTATTISYAYEAESPLQANTYFYKTPLNSNWIDIASENNKYKLLMGVQYDNTLPVSSTRFNGYKLSDKNVLKWNTYTEVNNDHFVIERSTNGHDFSPIATVNTLAPMGNSSSTLSYTYVDQGTPMVNTFYRLKQVNKQAEFALSDVIMLKGDGKIPFVVNNIFPNPVEATVKLNYSTPNAGNSTILLIDAVGRIVNQTTITSVEGDNQQQINLSRLIKGQYFLQLINSTGKSNVIKVIKN